VCLARSYDGQANYGIREMLAVPCEKNPYGVRSGQGNVLRICLRRRWEQPGAEKVFGKAVCTGVEHELGYSGKSLEARRRGRDIACGCLRENSIRDEERVVVPISVPPNACQALAPCHGKITVQPGGQITDYARVDVNRRQPNAARRRFGNVVLGAQR
jgi:hypothetical protein